MKIDKELLKEQYKIILIILLLIAACLAIYYFHALLKQWAIFTHFFYIPIILSSLWWKRKGLVVALFLAMLLIFSHVFIRVDVITINDYFRAFALIIVSLVISTLRIQIEQAKKQNLFAYTRNKQMGKKLHESEELYHITLSSISDAVFLTDNKGAFISICPNADVIFGYSVKEIEEMNNISNLLGKGLFKHAELRHKREIRNIDWNIKDKFKEVHKLLVNVKKVSIKKGTVLYACRDVTERDKLYEQLIQSEKLSAVGQLAAGMAHEFNNILGIIRLKAQLSKMAADNKKKLPEYLTTIENQTERGSKIVNDINIFARPVSPNLILQDIGDIIKLTIKIVKKQLNLENISIRTDYQEHSKVLVDTGQFQQVFLNLLINARHAVRSKRKGKILISIKDSDNYVEIRFADNGMGMDKETQKDAFNPFFTTKGAMAKDKFGIKGTGLGLSITHSIIKQHKGTITVKSKSGEGTVFTILLPIAVYDKKRRMQAKKSNHRLDINSIKKSSILIVDDEDEITGSLSDMLKMRGIQKVLIANDSEEALRLFNRQNFDIVFQDIVMPGLDGKEIIKKMKKIKQDIYIVFITGQDRYKQDNFIRKNAYAFLRKPFNMDDILNVLNKIGEEKKQ